MEALPFEKEDPATADGAAQGLYQKPGSTDILAERKQLEFVRELENTPTGALCQPH